MCSTLELYATRICRVSIIVDKRWKHTLKTAFTTRLPGKVLGENPELTLSLPLDDGYSGCSRALYTRDIRWVETTQGINYSGYTLKGTLKGSDTNDLPCKSTW